MKALAPIVAISGLALLCSPASQSRAAERETAVLEDAAEVLDSLATIPLVGVPPYLLRDAVATAGACSLPAAPTARGVARSSFR